MYASCNGVIVLAIGWELALDLRFKNLGEALSIKRPPKAPKIYAQLLQNV